MQRPTIITVFGILNIAFAILGVLGSLAALLMISKMDANHNPTLRLMHENATYMGWMKLSMPLTLISSAVLLIAGIGLLKMKEWGRKLSIGFAVFDFLFTIVGIAMNFLYLTRPMLAQSAHQRAPERIGALFGAATGSAGGVFGLIFPVVLLVFMTRPHIAAMFRTVLPPPLPAAARRTVA